METKGAIVVLPPYQGWYRVAVTLPTGEDRTTTEILDGVG
jgi:hypothetical protein